MATACRRGARRRSIPSTGRAHDPHREENAMLRPQDTATRERKALDGLWQFRLDAEGVGRTAGWHTAPLVDARSMPVPASYNDVLVGTEGRDHVGDAWYQTSVRVPRGWTGQRIVLRFDS